MTDTDICNAALRLIGQGKTLGDLSDDIGSVADDCRFWYPKCRRELLEQYPWTFAQQQEELSLYSDDYLPQWRYAYYYPSYCLKIYWIDNYTTRAAYGGVYDYSIPSPYFPGSFYEPYWMVSARNDVGGEDAESRVILMNEAPTSDGPPLLWFVRDVTQTGLMPQTFQRVLEYLLAEKLMSTVAKKPGALAGIIRNGYLSSLEKARGTDYNQVNPRNIKKATAVRARR